MLRGAGQPFGDTLNVCAMPPLGGKRPLWTTEEGSRSCPGHREDLFTVFPDARASMT